MLFRLKILVLMMVAAHFVTSGVVAQQPQLALQQNQAQPRMISKRYVPQHMRYQRQNAPQPVVQAEYLSVSQEPYESVAEVISEPTPMVSGDCGCDGGGSGYVVGGPVEQVIGGCDQGCCGGCDQIDCRDCRISRDCWIKRAGGLFCNAEYFSGAAAFRSYGFDPGLTSVTAREAGTFGFHSGFNVGLPLYRLTCGLVSGQFGLRSVQSNFEGSPFSANDRQQLFMTAGFFRRVDYGFQFGTVVDILREDWIAQLDLIQVRGELSYVWPAGSSFGFRFSEGVQDDNAPGQIGAVQLPMIRNAILDTNRFFFRKASSCGGYAEAFIGWSDESHTIYGVDADLPIGNCTALQAGFSYLSPDDSAVAGNTEAWNIYLGLTYRPRGRGWYKFYHRPLLPVADNGSMIIRRN